LASSLSWRAALSSALLPLLLLAASLIPLPLHAQASAPVAAAPAGRATIEAFVREGCPHCAQAEKFLAQLGRERPDLTIVVRDVGKDREAMKRLNEIATATHSGAPRVPATFVGGQLITGYSEEASTDRLIRDALRGQKAAPTSGLDTGSCAADDNALACAAEPSAQQEEAFSVAIFGRTITLDDVGLPAFTLAMGLLDGFNPCSMWVLILMISLLAPLNDRKRMLAVAGTFVLIEGIAYFLFMTAWLNLFLFIGLSRISQLVIAAIAIVAGLINMKDFVAFGKGVSLSIPDKAKPGIYKRMRDVVHAKSLPAAIIGVTILAILIQVVEFMCTSGFPALFTRILTLRALEPAAYYGYILLYIAAYMLDDVIVLTIGVVTLSRHRLQEKEGRWLKLISGVVMVGLGVYLVVAE
jgi:glutaredoxin